MSGPLLAHDEENVAVADSVSAHKELSILTCSLAGVSRCVQEVVQWQRWNFRCGSRWTASPAQRARLEIDRDRLRHRVADTASPLQFERPFIPTL